MENEISDWVSDGMLHISREGLRSFLRSQGYSIRGFASMIGVPSTTINSWIKTGRLTTVAKKAIEYGLWKIKIGVMK